MAFCGVGNPQAFFAHARGDGHEIVYMRAFADHHVYTQGDVDELVSEAKQHGAATLLTTAKDAVKLHALRFELPCQVLEIDVVLDDEEKMLEMLRVSLTTEDTEEHRGRRDFKFMMANLK